MRILLVEDHADTMEVNRLVLSRWGYTVTGATSAEAVRLCEEHSFDLLICDIGLPDSSGINVLKTIRSAYPTLRSIALTGYGMPHEVQAIRDAGFDLHLLKPIDFAALKSSLTEITLGYSATGTRSSDGMAPPAR